MTKPAFAKTATAIILSLVLILMPVRFSPVLAQTVPTVGFTMSPSVFPQGQATSAMLCTSPLPAAGALGFNQNDVIGFQFDNSIGTVTSVDNPVLVHSSTLLSTDFDAHLNNVNHNKLSITYTNTNSKLFAYTDTVCARVTFSASATAGSAVVRYSSKFTGLAGVIADLPYLTTTVVDFPIGPAGPQGVQGIQGIQGPKGDKGNAGPAGTPPDLSSALARLSALEGTIAPGRAYVTNQVSKDVSVIDTYTNTVLATIPVGSAPIGVAINPPGTRAYVADATGGELSVIDIATNTVVATVPVNGVNLCGVAFNPAGTLIYVTSASDAFSSRLIVIDTATNTVLTTVVVGSFPFSVAINGGRAYVANSFSNNVSVINTTTNTVAATIPVGTNPTGVAVNPAGTRAYVPNAISNTLSVIDTSTNAVVATVAVGSSPSGVAVNPTGTRVYVTNAFDNSVSVIDTSANTVETTILVGGSPHGVALNPAGTRVYVTNKFSTVSVIDTATNTVVATVPVGLSSIGIAVR